MTDERLTAPGSLRISEQHAETPSIPLLHGIAVLNGLGTMLLGPILPLLAAHWSLSDAQSGLLLTSQFCGAFLGGVSTSFRLRRGTLEGVAAAAAGLCVFAFAPGLPLACCGLIVAGFGIGRAITTVNIIAGTRGATQRGAALSRINLSWSLGALSSPLLAAWLTPHVALPHLLAGFAFLYLSVSLWLMLQMRSQPSETDPDTSPTDTPASSFRALLFLHFFALLLLYGGLETCLSAWLTTFSMRYGRDSLLLSEYTTVLLLSGLTAGRALAAWLLLHMRDRTLVRVALILSAALAAALASAHHTAPIAALAVLLGVTMAPIFPATFAMLLSHTPPARKAGLVLAASGLGAAALPALMGLVSTRAGSLQLALVIPVAAAVCMLALSFSPSSADPARS